MNGRIIPKVESFLIKEKVDNRGSKIKRLRSSGESILALILSALRMLYDSELTVYHSDIIPNSPV